MPKLPTVQIVGENGNAVTINKTDYDPDVHQLIEGETAPAQPPQEPAKTGNIHDGNEVTTPPAQPPAQPPAEGNGDGNGEGTTPPAQPPAEGDKPTLGVIAAGKRFKPATPDGKAFEHEAFQKTGYASEAEAWQAIMAFNS